VSGCLPIAYVDESVNVDFNPKAMINMAALGTDAFEVLKMKLTNGSLEAFVEEPLLLKVPSLQKLKIFLKTVVSSAV